MDNPWNNDQPQDDTRKDEPVPVAAAPAFSAFSPVDGYGSPPPRRKHSGLGIASFSIFGGMAVIFIILLVAFIAKLTSVIDFTSETVDTDEITRKLEEMPELAVLPFLMFGTFIGNLVGLVLGIIGLSQKERKKVFAVLGTVFNGIVIGFLTLFLIIGLLAAFAA